MNPTPWGLELTIPVFEYTAGSLSLTALTVVEECSTRLVNARPGGGVILGRIIGLIGCTTLVIAAMRLTNLQYIETTAVKGGENRSAAQVKLTPREHYKRGKELYLRGRYVESLSHLEEASASTSGLTASERRQADDCLNRARTKMQALANKSGPATKSVVRGQSDSWDEPAPAEDSDTEEIAKDRVNQLLIQAKAAYNAGSQKEAVKLAQLANNLAKTSKLKFSKAEMSPGEFLAKLSSAKLDLTAAAKSSQDWFSGDADSPIDRSVKPAVAQGNSRKDIRQTSSKEGSFDANDAFAPETDRTAATSRKPGTAKTQAMALVAQARKDIQAGRLDDAKRRALEAHEIDASYDLIEDRPELLLATSIVA